METIDSGCKPESADKQSKTPKGCSNALKGTKECSDARRARIVSRGVCYNTLSGAVCSATQQMRVFQQPQVISAY